MISFRSYFDDFPKLCWFIVVGLKSSSHCANFCLLPCRVVLDVQVILEITQ
jgi:hypothetical protein